jgi:SAM-dependent methyltransferase
MASDHDGIDGQRRHWRSTFEGNPTMYGTQPSEPGRYAVELFRAEGVRDVAELGAGQGRDTLAFLQAGMTVTALDYADEGLAELREAAVATGAGDRLTTIVSDAREPLPLPDAGMDAVYSRMLFSMALSTPELERLAAEIHRVLRHGGLHVYTVRNIGDAHYRAGTEHRTVLGFATKSGRTHSPSSAENGRTQSWTRCPFAIGKRNLQLLQRSAVVRTTAAVDIPGS